jgi:hypothetical protein
VALARKLAGVLHAMWSDGKVSSGGVPGLSVSGRRNSANGRPALAAHADAIQVSSAKAEQLSSS